MLLFPRHTESLREKRTASYWVSWYWLSQNKYISESFHALSKCSCRYFLFHRMRWWLKMVMTLIALLWLCSVAEALSMSHDSGWGYFSDGNSYAGVCKQRKGKWACLQYTKELRNQQSQKQHLKWVAKVGFLGMERIWMLIGRSILDSQWMLL